MKKLIVLALISMSLIGTSSYASSTGTSADSTISKDLTQAVDKILYPDRSVSDGSVDIDSPFLRCIKKYKKRCLNSHHPLRCREILVRFCKKQTDKKVNDRVKYCIKSNLKRCLTHYSAKECRVLLTNACSLSKEEKWDRDCVKKLAPRCVHAMLTRDECKEKLAPYCKK